MKASWLFTKHPILVDPDLATVIGLNEAIVLQQLNYWLHSKSAKRIDGHLWIYNTYENWQKQNFPFWSIPTIRRTFTSLKKKGIVVTSNFNKAGFDKTKWYSIDETILNQLMISACDQNDQTMRSKRSDGGDQNDHTYTRDYTENTTEITSSSNEETQEQDSEEISQFIKYFERSTFVETTPIQKSRLRSLLKSIPHKDREAIVESIVQGIPIKVKDPVSYFAKSLINASQEAKQ